MGHGCPFYRDGALSFEDNLRYNMQKCGGSGRKSEQEDYSEKTTSS